MEKYEIIDNNGYVNVNIDSDEEWDLLFLASSPIFENLEKTICDNNYIIKDIHYDYEKHNWEILTNIPIDKQNIVEF